MSNGVEPVNLVISTKWLPNNHKGPFFGQHPINKISEEAKMYL